MMKEGHTVILVGKIKEVFWQYDGIWWLVPTLVDGGQTGIFVVRKSDTFSRLCLRFKSWHGHHCINKRKWKICKHFLYLYGAIGYDYVFRSKLIHIHTTGHNVYMFTLYFGQDTPCCGSNVRSFTFGSHSQHRSLWNS